MTSESNYALSIRVTAGTKAALERAAAIKIADRDVVTTSNRERRARKSGRNQAVDI